MMRTADILDSCLLAATIHERLLARLELCKRAKQRCPLE